MNPPLISIPPSAAHTHTVIFLHGRGDTAQNFASSLGYATDSRSLTFPEIFPSFRWVFPQACMRPRAAFPGEKLSQWFDIWSVGDFSEREDLQAPGLRESVAFARAVLAGEAHILGGRWDRVVLAGISQGAAVCSHTLLNLDVPPPTPTPEERGPRRLGAFLGFSCRMPFPERSLDETRKVLSLEGGPDDEDEEVLRNTPVLLEHCVDDPIVMVGNGRVLRDTLRGFGARVAWKEYPNGGHWFNSPAGVDDVVEFLERYVVEKPKS